MIEAPTDLIAPTVSFTSPVNSTTGVAINKKIAATFSEAMDPTTISTSTFTLKKGTTAVAGTVTYSGVTAVFKPTSNLDISTAYTATITTAVKDLAGNAMIATKSWSFITGTSADTTAPTVISTINANGATGVARNTKVGATFSEVMDPATISNATFTLKQGTTVIAGTVSYSGLDLVFTPASLLAANTSYEATITTGAKDLAGNALAADKVWSFRTATVVGAGPAPVDLGFAGDFAILSKTSIVLATDATARVHGNIGVSPAAASFITNASLIADSTNTFSTSTQVPGYKVYAADYTPPTPGYLTTAVHNMEAAFTDAQGRSTAPVVELGSGHIGGLTLAPGLYTWSSNVDIATDMYLAGGVNDVWIFQCAQNLTLANGIMVHLTGGAVAKNVFWQVSGNTILGTTSVMNGNMICLTDMTMNTGSTLNGRLLGQTAVILQKNTIVNLP